MNVTDTNKAIGCSLPIADQKYKGPLNSDGVRNGIGEQKWHKAWNQKYTGQFCNDCLNKQGTYEWINGKEKYVYEGRFYANRMEGYGVTSYPDGSNFRGLFRQNHRFGPGILTHSDGKQDVGLWNGLNMVRICGKILDCDVPVLAKSIRAKAYLARYKEIVPISFTKISKNFATEILTELNASPKVMEKKEMLFNNSIRNYTSAFMNKKKMHGQFFEDVPNKIFSLGKIVDGKKKSEYKIVEDIIAWNNEPLMISLQKHTFLHGKYEETAFCNSNAILNGDRELFEPAGKLELANLFFLYYCKQGKYKSISKLVVDYDLYPNVTDVTGNTGLHLAVACQWFRTIKVLICFGVNLDVLNDEGLTPIIIALLQYIAICEEVYNYEVAFLPPLKENTGESVGYFWRAALYAQPSQYMRTFSATAFDTEKYILSTACVHPEPPKIEEEEKSITTKVQLIEPGTTKSYKSSQELKMASSLILRKKELICKTVKLLLSYGANPNFGNIPLPPLILALFTKDLKILLSLIKFGANCDIRSFQQEGGLTPLHVLCSLDPNPIISSQAKILLKSGALPNLRTNIEHWPEEKIILDPGSICMDEGKTPLHILCMRYDYENDYADYMENLYDVLYKAGANPNLYYLGHTCLSLAVLRGNTKMIENILGSFEIDPNQILGCNMGVALTVLILKKYTNILPLPNCKEVYKILHKFNANPFNKILDCDNAIEFCEEENRDPLQEKGKKQKKDKNNKKKTNKNVIKCLYANAGDFLNRHIQAKVVEIIYKYKIECDIVDDIFDKMVLFLTVPEIMKMLQILLNHDILVYNMLGFYALVKYIDIENKSIKNKKSKSKKTGNGDNVEYLIDEIEKIEKQIQPLKNIYAPPPEIDQDEEKYKVCYSCYKSKDKILVRCPDCELVYFCSEKCNKKNNKNKTTKHKCKTVFYNRELRKMQQSSSTSIPTKLDEFKKVREKFLENSDFDFELRYAFAEIELYRKRQDQSDEDSVIDKKRKSKSATSKSKEKKENMVHQGDKSKKRKSKGKDGIKK